MLTQRWRDGRHSWRHTSEGGFNPLRYDVGIPDPWLARTFVESHHYSHRYVAASREYGLFEGDELIGVAVLSVPMRRSVLTNVLPDLVPYRESLELGRFVLLDRVPANAESWFLARAFELAASDGVRGVVSFSDPVRRYAADGRIVMPGHVGTIYQATNAIYAGRSTPKVMRLLPDGTVLSERAISKIRGGEVGADYAERQIVAAGAKPRGPSQDRRAWLAGALREVTTVARHGGNHRYVFTIGPARRRVRIIAPVLPYPKEIDR